MRVAYVNQDPGIRAHKKKGASVHVASMIDAMTDEGAQVELVEEVGNAETLEALENLHTVQPLDLVYERYSLGGCGGARFASETGVPLVLEVNSPLIDEAREHRAYAVTDEDCFSEAFVFSKAIRIFAVSSAVARYVVERDQRPEIVLVRPNAVDSRRFRSRANDDLRREWVPAADRLVLGFHGRLRPWHGFDRLATAADELIARGHSIHILVVGEGDFECHLERLPSDRYTIVGWRPHEAVASLVACFDVLPLSYPPGAPCYFSPLKLLEGMACGAVPVVPALGDLKDVVEDGVNGLVYDAAHAGSLTRAIERLAVERDLRTRLASAAIDTASERSWTSLAGEVLGTAGGVTTS